jgi:hypothetical protein
MDTMRDYTPFRALLDQLCASWDRPPAKDELVQAYWAALKDVSLAEVKRNIERLIRTGTSVTKWPKPGDLRDEAPSNSRNSSMEADFAQAEQRAIRNLEEQRQRDPELWRLETGIAKCARIMVTEHEGSPQYAEAVRLDRLYRDQRMEVWRQRAAAKP